MAALAMEAVDQIPVCPFVMAFAAKFAGVPYGKYCTDYREMAKAQIACVTHFGYDIVTADTDAYREAEACGAEIEFPEDSLPVEKRAALAEKKDLVKLELPEIQNAPRLADKVAGVKELKKQVGDEIPVLGWVEGPYQSAAIMRGLTEFMMDTVMDRSFVQDLLEFTTQLAIDFGLAQVEAGADLIGIGDAIASLISPENYQTDVLPYTQRLVKTLQEQGVKVKYHICGDTTHLLPQIKELGVDLINVDSKVDLAQARSILSQVCLKGNLDPTAVMLQGTEEEVFAAAKKAIAVGGRGYILSPGCELPKDVPHENFKALIKAAKEIPQE